MSKPIEQVISEVEVLVSICEITLSIVPMSLDKIVFKYSHQNACTAMKLCRGDLKGRKKIIDGYVDLSNTYLASLVSRADKLVSSCLDEYMQLIEPHPVIELSECALRMWSLQSYKCDICEAYTKKAGELIDILKNM